MALMLAIWSAQPNWMPRKPKLMFQICQKLRGGFCMGKEGADQEESRVGCGVIKRRFDVGSQATGDAGKAHVVIARTGGSFYD